MQICNYFPTWKVLLAQCGDWVIYTRKPSHNVPFSDHAPIFPATKHSIYCRISAQAIGYSHSAAMLRSYYAATSCVATAKAQALEKHHRCSFYRFSCKNETKLCYNTKGRPENTPSCNTSATMATIQGTAHCRCNGYRQCCHGCCSRDFFTHNKLTLLWGKTKDMH